MQQDCSDLSDPRLKGDTLVYLTKEIASITLKTALRGDQVSKLKKDNPELLSSAVICLLIFAQKDILCKKMNAEQIVSVAREIIVTFWYLKIEEIAYVLKQGLLGSYIRKADYCFDKVLIFSWLQEYDSCKDDKNYSSAKMDTIEQMNKDVDAKNLTPLHLLEKSEIKNELERVQLMYEEYKNSVGQSEEDKKIIENIEREKEGRLIVLNALKKKWQIECKYTNYNHKDIPKLRDRYKELNAELNKLVKKQNLTNEESVLYIDLQNEIDYVSYLGKHLKKKLD